MRVDAAVFVVFALLFLALGCQVVLVRLYSRMCRILVVFNCASKRRLLAMLK